MLFANSFESEICLGAPRLDALGLGYDLPVSQAVYAIDAFPDDDLLWRIEWIGGVGYNTSVPSEPQIDVCLAQLPKGEKNPLSARTRAGVASGIKYSGDPPGPITVPGGDLYTSIDNVSPRAAQVRRHPDLY
jgi:hypothetical protein